MLASWNVPAATKGKIYSGVYIRYSASGYPGKTGGTQIYKGAGSNTTAGGTSTSYLDLPALSTKYYLSIYPYATTSAGEIIGEVLNATVTTSGELVVTFTAGKSYIIPAGFSKMDLFAVGGGSGGRAGGGGGGGGYTKTVFGIAVSAGEVLSVIVGSGGRGGLIGGAPSTGEGGGTSSVTRNGTTLISAEGGLCVHRPDTTMIYMTSGCAGGSGGGALGYIYSSSTDHGGAGGTDGSNGKKPDQYDHYAGVGQGTTTRAWGAANGVLHSGAGGGGGYSRYNTRFSSGGAGGDGGGGAGGRGGYREEGNDNYHYFPGLAGGNAAEGTGGGGGGGGLGYDDKSAGVGGNGGSGVVIARLY